MLDDRTWVLFGGGGFVGTHLALHLLQRAVAKKIVLADLVFPDLERMQPAYRAALESGRLEQKVVDIREPIGTLDLDRIDVAVHLAAVHREPGHTPREYFETNVRGTEQIVRWAESLGCPSIVFTSSISVYGDTRSGVDESSLPMPETPYGISKLVAEKILEGWAAPAGRKLLILRLAVVYGAGERGNVTRLVQAVARRRFAYVGNRTVRKSGGYVKELCHCLTWLLERQEQAGARRLLVNFCMPEPTTLGDFVETIKQALGMPAFVPRMPYQAAHAAARLISGICGALRISTGIHPRRIEKLIWPTDVRPAYLTTSGYPFAFSLHSSIEDWRNECPEEWR